VPAVPTVKLAVEALVMVGAEALVKVNDWLTGVPCPLDAVIVSGKAPPVPVAEVPEMVAVPFPLSLKDSPLGRLPVSLSAGVGDPVVVTVKLKTRPTTEVAALALVMVGPALTTVMVRFKVAVEPEELVAWMVTG
jgi:hypothetical protein